MHPAHRCTLLALAAVLCGTLCLSAQTVRSTQAIVPASFTPAPGAATSISSSSDDLPDAPRSSSDDQPAAASTARSTGEIASKYRLSIQPGQAAQPLSAHEKVTFGFVHALNPVNIFLWTISSAYSQGIDSAPHFGQGWGPYGQRYGSAAARGTLQTLATDSVFAPIFHDDPRYYVLGRDHKPLNRGIYAVTRTVITRSDNGQKRINLPLLLGYAVAAGTTSAFYPQSDRTGKQTAETYGGSLGGEAIFFVYSEFIDDALRIAHLRK